MGLTNVTMRIRKRRKSKRSEEVEFLVDSGAFYTVVPTRLLKRLGIEPVETESFLLADGEKITRKVGEAYLEFGERHGTSKVIFGQRGDMTLVGSLALEVLGLMLDPLKRELRPLPMLLT